MQVYVVLITLAAISLNVYGAWLALKVGIMAGVVRAAPHLILSKQEDRMVWWTIVRCLFSITASLVTLLILATT